MNAVTKPTQSESMQWTKISTEQLEFFDANGYLIVPNALDQAMVDRLIEAGDRLVAGDRLANRQTTGGFDGFRNVVSIDEAFLPLLTWSKTLPLLVQIMGPNVQLHTSHQIWANPDAPGTDPGRRMPGWHRDMSVVNRDLDDACMPRLEIKIGYFLTDCSSPNCGQTMVVPGSHRWKRIDKPAHGDPPGALEPKLRPGDALFFENRTLHAGGANLTSRLRKAVMFGYSHRWLRPDDYDRQDSAFLETLNPLQRCLVDARAMNYDAQGRFQPKGEPTIVEQLAAEHGCTTAGCH